MLCENLNLTGKPRDFPVVSFSKALSEKSEMVFGKKRVKTGAKAV
jgi:hypothetical protein